MEHDRETQAELIDLGQASIETLGPNGGVGDEAITQQRLGLTDD